MARRNDSLLVSFLPVVGKFDRCVRVLPRASVLGAACAVWQSHSDCLRQFGTNAGAIHSWSVHHHRRRKPCPFMARGSQIRPAKRHR